MRRCSPPAVRPAGPHWRACCLAEQRELIVANTRDGLTAARARGGVGGRRPRLSADQGALAQHLYDAREKTAQQIADLFGVPGSTVYGHLDEATTVPGQPRTDPSTQMQPTLCPPPEIGFDTALGPC
ncbi:hypothetical protein [Mangrovactinospora gilvigrisea]|uniref:hypothetical protein n=1 Tax=Mangrovactinospora gilvigrisea TaxID=1428644 RepID=UPI000AE0CB85|nr:hypothetical protein [Mangrovactinospora gilvigrisea]